MENLPNVAIAQFLGNVFSFNNSLKLNHWRSMGKGSYAHHIALDQAVDSLLDVTDRLVEVCYALDGELQIVVPETNNPADIVKHVEDFYAYIETSRELFPESFIQSILDDYQEAQQQLLYRLKYLY